MDTYMDTGSGRAGAQTRTPHTPLIFSQWVPFRARRRPGGPPIGEVERLTCPPQTGPVSGGQVNYPNTRLRTGSDSGFTASQAAPPAERIKGKAVISGDDLGVKRHFDSTPRQPDRNRLRTRSLCKLARHGHLAFLAMGAEIRIEQNFYFSS